MREIEPLDADADPDWDEPLELRLTPAAIIHALFASADSVHTGWESCVEGSLVVEDVTVNDERAGNHCRLVKQTYVEQEEPEEMWTDWTVEVRFGQVFVSGHWRTRESSVPADLDWCAAEAEKAFAGSCVLVGKRVRRGFIVEDPPRATDRPSRTHH